jgi:hypothetical protein
VFSVFALFLEKIIERVACIGRFHGRCLRSAPTRVSRFPLDGCSGHEKLAFVPEIFFGNTFGDGLCAFELGRSIKMTAILTGPEIGFTFLTLTFVGDVHGRWDNRPADGAANNILKAGHLDRARRFSCF